MSRFTDPLLVSPLPDGRTWVIKRDFGYDLDHEDSGRTVEVPVGFHTDFASVPRLFWALIPRWGVYGNAAVIHDYLYVFHPCSRQRADAIFDEAMRVLTTPTWQRLAILAAVRLIAWIYWAKRRARIANRCQVGVVRTRNGWRSSPRCA